MVQRPFETRKRARPMGRLSLRVVIGEPKSERDPEGVREVTMVTPTSVA
jgi:hypothetical protein